jgi:hypothetical protein
LFNVELSVSGHGGYAVVALCGELDLADAPVLASHLIATVAAFGPLIISASHDPITPKYRLVPDRHRPPAPADCAGLAVLRNCS